MYIHSYSLQGKRESNEDQHVGILNLNGNNKKINKVNFVGVFDGHGGKLVSKFLKNNMPQYIMKKSKVNIYQQKKHVTGYFFNHLYDKLQNDLKLKHPTAANRCGSTALCGIHYLNEKGQPMLWMVNVGDSRAVMCNYKGQEVLLTKDHKPNVKSEKERIKRLGGRIKFDGADWRIKDLSLSRAFGDIDTAPYVTHRPDIFRYRLNKGDKYIIFACDGLWDVVSNKNAVNFVNNLLEKKYTGNIAKKLSEYAIKKGSYDNVTVSILFL